MTIQLSHPITYIKGDEEGQVLMDKSLEALSGLVTLNLCEFDLSLQSRLDTLDGVTRDAAAHCKEHKVGLKAPTITQGREAEGTRLPSPNITLRRGIGGVAIVREANLIPGVEPPNRNLTAPITVIRKATEGIYEAMEWETEDGQQVYRQEFMSREKMQALAEFAVAYALENEIILWSATKHTISRKFEGTLQETLDEVAARAAESDGLQYHAWLIDAAYQALMRPPKSGLAVVCDNFNGDCLGDLVPAMFGSVAGCGSILVGEGGARLFDPPHGTVPTLFNQDKANPLATLIAISGAIGYAGLLEKDDAARTFARELKASAFAVIEEGIATLDLVGEERATSTSGFLDAVRKRVES